MKLETFAYKKGSGWSMGTLPALDSDQTLVVVFGAPSFRDAPEPVQHLLRAYPTSHVIGCSSSGEIFDTAVYDDSLSVSVIRFEHTRLASVTAACSSAQGSFAAGKAIADELHRPDLRGVLVLSDGLQVNGSELVKGINSVLPDSVVVTGGLAGDGDRFKNTWVLHEGMLQSGYITAVGFYGERIQIGHGSKGGWDVFGPERRVTRSEGNRLYELDGKPALELYKTYLGEQSSGLPASGLLFPLALRANAADEKSVVRTILAVDEAQQAMIFAGDIPQGYLAQLMKANFDRLIGGASEAAALAKTPADGASPTLSIAISCVGRRLVLGERTDEELEATLDVLPKGTRQIGFYSYGEISPYAAGYCDLHNQTMTLTMVSER
jgi:hypothetical protein